MRCRSVSLFREVYPECLRQRFTIDSSKGVARIRANQGHSIKAVDDSRLLTPVDSAAEVPLCLHGTYERFRTSIEQGGLKVRGGGSGGQRDKPRHSSCIGKERGAHEVMGRNHVHCSVQLPRPGDVISGMRKEWDIVVEIDVAKAMAAGVVFQRSSNNVILTRGIDGVPSSPRCHTVLAQRRLMPCP